MTILINWIINAIAVFASAYILPGVQVDGFFVALVVAVVLGIVNTFIKPLLVVLTLPINVLTLGLFTLVINAVLILLVSNLVSGFQVDGFWWAVLYSIILSLVSSVLFGLQDTK